MSQQTAPIWSIIEKILAEAGDLGDTEYMAKKSFDGKLITVTGAIDNLNNTIEHIVPNGKRFYFHSAKIVITSHTVPAVFPGTSPANTPTLDAVEADLLIDNVVKDTTNIGVLAQSSFRGSGTGAIGGYGTIGDGHFDVKGLSLVGDGIKKIEIKNTDDDGTAIATLIGFEEDTLTDPTLLAQSISVEASVSGETGDLAFITEKVQAGDYFQVSGDIDTGGSDIEFIVPNGKTAFLLEAKIIITNHPTASSRTSGGTTTQKDIVSAALKIASVIKDETTVGEATAAGIAGSNQNGGGCGSGYGNLGNGKFNVKGLSLIGNGVDEATNKITVENIFDDGSAFATMSGYLVDT